MKSKEGFQKVRANLKSSRNRDYFLEVMETIEFLKKIDLVTVFQTLKVSTLKTKG